MTEDHAAELARVQALLDHAQQRSIASLAAAKDAYLRGRKDGYGHGFEQGVIQGRRQAADAVLTLTEPKDGVYRSETVLDAYAVAAEIAAGTENRREVSAP